LKEKDPRQGANSPKTGSEGGIPQKKIHLGSVLSSGFSPQLTWSHYRALMRVKDEEARNFYELEAIECGWSKLQLERQVHSFYYDRIIANRGERGLLSEGRERLPGETVNPAHLIKSPITCSVT
jgi:hypothetical protein